jgi:hypothetical protein
VAYTKPSKAPKDRMIVLTNSLGRVCGYIRKDPDQGPDEAPIFRWAERLGLWSEPYPTQLSAQQGFARHKYNAKRLPQGQYNP